MFVRKFLLIGSVILLYGLPNSSVGQNLEDYWKNPFGCKIQPVDSVLSAGRVRLFYDIRAWLQWDTVEARVITYGNIGYHGEKKWKMVINKWDKIKIPFEVDLPKDDTVGIRVEFYVDGSLASAGQRFFTTTDDTVKLFGARPVPYKGSRRLIGIPDTLKPTWGMTKEEIREYYSRGDTVEMQPYKPTKEELQRENEQKSDTLTTEERRRQLEQEPYMGPHKSQTVMFDAKPWRRKKGEYKFQKLQGITMEQMYIDGLRRKGDDTTKVEMVVDLRDPTDYEYVNRLFEEMTPTDTAGIYHILMTIDEIDDLKERGINVKPTQFLFPPKDYKPITVPPPPTKTKH